MTWAKISDTFNDHPILLGLPRGVRLLFVESIVWCCKQETDGEIPTGAVPRFTDEADLPAATAALVDVGLWAVTATGFRIPDFLVNQRSKEEITAGREAGAQRQERLRRHRVGDHVLCDSRYCRHAVTNAVSHAISNGVSNDPPARPVRSSSVGKGRGSAPASLAVGQGAAPLANHPPRVTWLTGGK